MNHAFVETSQIQWVSGHQPNFLPWFGYFEKWLSCDVFVHSDDVQFPAKSFSNRAQFSIDERMQWVTLPVHNHGRPRIYEIRFSDDKRLQAHVLNKIQAGIWDEPHRRDAAQVIDFLEGALASCQSLACLNIETNDYIAGLIGIDIPAIRGKDIGLQQYSGTCRLIERCRILGAEGYLYGQGATGYQDDDMLRQAGIRLRQVQYEMTPRLFGDLASCSIAQGIARVGLASIKNSVHSALESRRSQPCQ